MTKQEKLLVDVSNILEQCGVKHCLMWGTLLGAIRDNKLIEWDSKDLDLGIFDSFWKYDKTWYKFNILLLKHNYRVSYCRAR